MRLDSSAIEMNSVGMTTPRCGWFHRTSASTPSSSRLVRSTTGWNSRKNSFAGQRQVDVLLQPQAIVNLFLHVRLEQHEARLAGGLRAVHGDVGVAQQLLASSPGREQATPMLADASVSLPSSSSGRLNAAVIGVADALHVVRRCGCPPAGWRTRRRPGARQSPTGGWSSPAAARPPAAAGRRRRDRACRSRS